MTNTWNHGNALVVENPENLSRVGYFGWGADMLVVPGKACWFHIPLPVPTAAASARIALEKLTLLFQAEHGSIRRVHVYDGSTRFHMVDNLNLAGNHLSGPDAQNTLVLVNMTSIPRPIFHPILFGVGVSFQFVADNVQGHLVLAGAGGTYNV